MPIIKGSASEFTTLSRVNATQTTDPEKKSRTFVATNKMVIAPIVRASSTSMMPLSQVVTFAFTGGSQKFTVPAQVNAVFVTLLGAGGASHGGGSYLNGGSGGYVYGRLGVTPGEPLDIIVGGGGVGVVGGYGGGGTGWDTKTSNTPGGGGGRTAIQRQGADIVTAGGGGGAGRGPSGVNGYGGAGGGPVGASAGDATASNGKGGTQTAGGAAGSSSTETGVAGSKYQGGNGAIGIITGLTLNNSSGNMTITGTIPTIAGNKYGFYVTISDSSNSSLNGSWQVSGDQYTGGWTTNSVTVITNISDSITNITGATMRGNNDDTGGGGGGWFGGGGGGLDVTGNYGGGGGGGSSYVALLDQTYSIVDAQGQGAPGGKDAGATLQAPGGNGSCIIQYTVIPGYHDWKSLPFNGRIYIT
jgi:hypothetical protein